MTAINVFVRPKAVHFVSDGNHSDADGRVFAIGSKLALFPEFNGILATAGPVAFGLQLANQIRLRSYACPYDALNGLHDDVAAARLLIPGGANTQAAMGVVGSGIGGGVYMQGGDRPTFMHVGDSVQTGATCASFDPENPEEACLSILEEQRAASPVKVGGLCQYAVVTEAGISTRVLHRWSEDVVGD